jgi:hypothetical protein
VETTPMILVAYRLLCAAMAALAVWSLLRDGSRQEKAAAALVMVPLVLRALLVK